MCTYFKKLIKFFLISLLMPFSFGFLISPWIGGYSSWVNSIKTDWYNKNYAVDVIPLYLIKDDGSIINSVRKQPNNIFEIREYINGSEVTKGNLIINGRLLVHEFDKEKKYSSLFLTEDFPEINSSEIFWQFEIINKGRKDLYFFQIRIKLEQGEISNVNTSCKINEIRYDKSLNSKEIILTPLYSLLKNDICTVRFKSNKKEMPLIEIDSLKKPDIQIEDLNAKYILITD